MPILGYGEGASTRNIQQNQALAAPSSALKRSQTTSKAPDIRHELQKLRQKPVMSSL